MSNCFSCCRPKFDDKDDDDYDNDNQGLFWDIINPPKICGINSGRVATFSEPVLKLDEPSDCGK